MGVYGGVETSSLELVVVEKEGVEVGCSSSEQEVVEEEKVLGGIALDME